MDILFDVLRSVLDNAKSGYHELSDAEKYASFGLKGKERIKFRIFIEEEATAHAGMKKAYAEKSEINKKLQKTYAEKSEINRKLQITYREKYERGLKIKSLEKELASVKKSRSYRLARIIGFPVRMFRKMVKKIQS